MHAGVASPPRLMWPLLQLVAGSRVASLELSCLAAGEASSAASWQCEDARGSVIVSASETGRFKAVVDGHGSVYIGRQGDHAAAGVHWQFELSTATATAEEPGWVSSALELIGGVGPHKVVTDPPPCTEEMAVFWRAPGAERTWQGAVTVGLGLGQNTFAGHRFEIMPAATAAEKGLIPAASTTRCKELGAHTPTYRLLRERDYLGARGALHALSVENGCIEVDMGGQFHEPSASAAMLSAARLRFDAAQVNHTIFARQRRRQIRSRSIEAEEWEATTALLRERVAVLDRAAERVRTTEGASITTLGQIHNRLLGQDQPLLDKLLAIYNAHVLLPATPPAVVTEAAGSPVLNSEINWRDVRASFWRRGIVELEQVLSPAAADELQQELLERTRYTKLRDAYVEAPPSTFHPPVLMKLALELESQLGDVFTGLHLQRWWAFTQTDEETRRNQDGSSKGVELHADAATVSFNLWMTPMSARLSGGGLDIWRAMPNDTEHASQYNKQHWDEAEKASIMANPKTHVAYGYNKAILFLSDYFHRTEDFEFKQGYENRRINVAMLWGEKQPGELGPAWSLA